MKVRRFIVVLAAVVLAMAAVSFSHAQKTGDAAPAKEGVMSAAEVGGKLFPDKVFFRGQSAPVQARNSGGVRYRDGFMVLGALVDNSGYSSGVRERYQGYLMTEVPIEIGVQALKPGVYGFGFLDGGKFVVMDIGANDLFRISSTKDADIKRPVPLQFTAGTGGVYRLYKGREFVEFHRVQ
jgi:hypothetical protein